MRLNIVIDDKLMQQALEASGLTTQRAVVEEGLRLLVQMDHQRSIRTLRGNLKWDADLDAMRTDR